MTTAPTICRHCGGTERYTKEVSAVGPYGPDLLPVGFFTKRTLRIEVCAGCGLVDWFVPERLLDKVKTRFTRIS